MPLDALLRKEKRKEEKGKQLDCPPLYCQLKQIELYSKAPSQVNALNHKLLSLIQSTTQSGKNIVAKISCFTFPYSSHSLSLSGDFLANLNWVHLYTTLILLSCNKPGVLMKNSKSIDFSFSG